MRVALVHDYLTQRGGAERVVLALHRLFPDAPIYTSVWDPDRTFREFRSATVHTSVLQRLPPQGFRWWLPFYPLVFEHFDLDDYDLVISSSSGWAHGARTAGRHVVYCHNPARWLYQQAAYFADGGPAPMWTAKVLLPLLGALRRWDSFVARRPTTYIANSHVVAGRIARIYRRTAAVVHPPVDLDRMARVRRGLARHYLVVARLLPYKRVDLALQACARRNAPVVVVGDGPARAALERSAPSCATFVGRVDDATLTELYGGARALIHAGEEDFGIVPLEAMAAGVPVVAYAAGGALETMIDGVTGALFDAQDEPSLSAALDRLESMRWDPTVLRARASEFSEERFHTRMLEALAS